MVDTCAGGPSLSLRLDLMVDTCAGGPSLSLRLDFIALPYLTPLPV